MRRFLLIVLALGLPTAATAAVRAQTITGSITANSGSSLTISSADRSLTCRVNGSKAQSAIARFGLGIRAAMVCAEHGDKLVLTRLSRLDAKEGTPTTTTTTTTTEPATTRRDARGKVTAAG